MGNLTHNDMGCHGSKFVHKHLPLRSRTLFGLLLCMLLALFFFLGLHLMDQQILSALCIVLALSLLMKLHNKVQSETILILPSLGLQVTTRFILGRESTIFIHLSQIKDVVINEAITMQCVKFYLIVLLKESKSNELQQLYPLFMHSCPELDQLIEVFNVIHNKLELNPT